MLNRQSVIALAVAMVLGVIAVFFANSYLNRSQQKAYEGGTTKVAVATVPLAYGVDITPDKVHFVDYPNTSIPAGAFTDAAVLMPAGKPARVALLPIGVNEPILANKITGEGQGASIAALLPEGMRAASVRINDVSGVANRTTPWWRRSA
jgi:pilus assembly protein CpaB